MRLPNVQNDAVSYAVPLVRRSYTRFVMVGMALIVFFTLVLIFLNATPSSFVSARSFTIDEGMGVTAIAERLEREGFIRSSFLFKLVVFIAYPNSIIAAGEYTFERPFSTQELVQNLVTGQTNVILTPVTFPEGWSVHDLRMYVEEFFPDADAAPYLAYEGTLFPETYFVASHESLDELIFRMREEFETRLTPYRDRIEQSGLSEKDVIIFASILEREANDKESMRRVSGVLHNRLTDGLPLQVDATFEYLLGKTSAELTVDDLAIDSPMNTYTHTGLPPQPIANPGSMAIEAVLDPIPSDNYFYLTGDDGVFYYAKTFEEHKRNKARYLR